MTFKETTDRFLSHAYSRVLSTQFDITFLLLQLNFHKTKEADCRANLTAAQL